MIITPDKNLRGYNSFAIPTIARYFIEVENDEDFIKSFAFIKSKSLKFFVLGGGSNVIFLEDYYDGVVLKIKRSGFRIDKNKKNIIASAGTVLDDFIEELCQNDIFSFSCLSLIPGTIGGAIYGNAGAYGLEIAEMVVAVKAFDMEKGIFFTLDNASCDFSYRNSVFKKNGNRFIVAEVTFSFDRQSKGRNATYRRFGDFLRESKIVIRSEKEIRDVVIEIRSKKFPDPSKYHTAGSIFKNAIISGEAFDNLKRKYPEIPHWRVGKDKIKISTGYLLDVVLGLRGASLGKLKVSASNALVFYTDVEMTGAEIFFTIEKIKREILEKTDVRLEEEVICLK